MARGGARTGARIAALALALAAAVVFPGAPGRAEACTGVTAVVDFGALGGGIQERCVSDGGGRPAWDVFEEAGFPLNAVQQYPDAVCRVSGKPANDPCYRMPPANAYWGLFWADGSGWVYSTKGARSLTVPAGGSVGLAWQSSTARRAPGATPPSPSPSPTPTKAPTKKAATSTATKAAATKPRAVTTSATPTPVPSTQSSAAARATPSAGSSASASVSAAVAAPATTATPSPSSMPTSAEAAGPVETRNAVAASGAGLPWFVPVGVLVLLAGGAGGATWWRRRAAG